jgi:predicted protein tyrosine phosphatase
MSESFADLVARPVSKCDEPSEILPGLFLGGHPGRYRQGFKMALGYPARWLRETLNVRLVVCCCASKNASQYVLENTDSSTVTLYSDEEAFVAAASAAGPSTVAKVNLPIVDEDYFDASVYFEEACRLLHHWHEHRRDAVLVHCQAGMSRSAAVLAAYLIRRFGPEHWQGLTAAAAGASLSEALIDVAAPAVSTACADWGPLQVLGFMESRRICVDPNPGFRVQLASWAASERASVNGAAARVAVAASVPPVEGASSSDGGGGGCTIRSMEGASA